MSKTPSPVPPKADPEPSEPTSAKPSAGSQSRGLFTRKGLVILLSVSLVVHGMVFGYLGLFSGKAERELTPEAEVALGTFCYHGDRVEGGRVTQVDFSLYLALANPGDRADWKLVAAHKYRLQEGVEELLRRAHAADFEDPVLRELKRRLRQRIEETLGRPVVADVMVTNLKVHWKPPEPKPSAEPRSSSETAEMVPWNEKASG